ncbi:hypothetical protein MOSL_2133 [Moraxella osloensis]|nr:hypothetical protein EOL70_24485 [Leucothrix sargassi]BAV12706.1 hypothetical protein MOSL_2133 [Moraxella osloensis]
MSESLHDYYDALERIKANKPVNIPKTLKISYDAVALEAGRGKGAIKKSRPIFADLIREIDKAIEEKKALSPDKLKITNLKSKVEELEQSLENALGRELSLLYENYQLKKQLNELTGSKVLPLRPKDSKNK